MKKKILIVDDDKQVLKSLEIVLSREGYTVETTANGEKAIEIIESENFHLALVDIIIPITDGLRILKKISKISPGTILFILTGYPTTLSRKKAKKLGVQEYIVKPCETDELLTLIKTALE